MKLVITDTNWADEMDVWGFEVVTDQTLALYTRIIEQAFKYEDEIVIYIGTNEEIQISNEDYLSHFEIKDITKDQVDSLKAIFDSTSNGLNFLDRIVESCLYIIEDNDLKLYKQFAKELDGE